MSLLMRWTRSCPNMLQTVASILTKPGLGLSLLPELRVCLYHQRCKLKSSLSYRYATSTLVDETRIRNRKRFHKLDQTKQQLKDTKAAIKGKLEGMKENIFTLPNGLSLLRIGLTPLLGYFVVTHEFTPALCLFAFAGATDLMDGYIARNFANQRSMLGSFLDPMADKLLVATLFVTLTYSSLIPVPLTALIITRDVILVGAGFYIRYQSLPAPRTVSKYFDVTMATAQLSPTMISKVNTTVQLMLVAFTLTAPVFDFVDHPLLQCLWYATGATTVLSGLSYLKSKNTYRFIKSSKDKR